MRVLVIGAGAREHALCWALRRSPDLKYLACMPGNGGTAAIAENVQLNPMHFAAVADWAVAERIDLVVVGPDDPLGAGIVDTLHARGLRTLGPTEAAARIESSKIWAKAFMARHDIPTAPARTVTPSGLESAVRSLHAADATYPVAIKADGLTGGKGVVIAQNAVEAEAVLREMLGGKFGAAGAQVLIESYMTGREVSVFALCDGTNYQLLGTACDHKRAFDGDEGPNTGGMGAYAPADWLSPETLTEIENTVIKPTIAGMAAEGVPFTGFLYVGLMITPEGPRVVEFNARFGDPEAQVVLPLLESDFLALCTAAANGRLGRLSAPTVRAESACGVVLAAGEYPGPGSKGAAITGLDAVEDGVLVFQAGTRLNDGQPETNGGRILTVVGIGSDRDAARAKAYANIERITFEGSRYRTDIGAK
jgi:phosphoribosylamine---glycine ligase